MGTVVERKDADGNKRYRAQIRINKQGIKHTESRTFSKKSLAQEWIKRREAEIERDPSILTEEHVKASMTLAEAIARYLDEVDGFSRTKRMGLRFLSDWPIAKVPLNELNRQHFSEFIVLRRKGYLLLGVAPVEASTASQDLQYLKSVLNHAELVWGETLSLHELELAQKGLRSARMIARSKVRDRLPTDTELEQLTRYFYEQWQRNRSTYPMHLIIWFAIYSCRRQNEMLSMFIPDFDRHNMTWLIRDLKNPNGSDGNHRYAVVTADCLQVIDVVLSDEIQARMQGKDQRLFPLSNKAASSYFTQACKFLDIDDLHFHDLRHEGATRLAESGLTIPQIQQVTLHETWSSLERYASSRLRHGKRLQFVDVMLAITDQQPSLSSLPPVERQDRPRGRPLTPKT